LPWQPFLSFYIWGVHWRHLMNTTEPSMCGCDAGLCQITLTTCFITYLSFENRPTSFPGQRSCEATKPGLFLVVFSLFYVVVFLCFSCMIICVHLA